MTRTDTSAMSTGELIDQFVQLSIQQGIAIDLSDGLEINRLGGKIFRIKDELKRRSGDHGRSLIRLLGHRNPYVRYNAATSLIRTVPVEAREVLETIANSNWYPLAGHAGMYLSNLDSGLFKPS